MNNSEQLDTGMPEKSTGSCNNTQNPSAKSIGIVGAGIMGRTLAWFLLEQGHRVDLFDADDISGKDSCSYAAAGMLAPFAELENSDALMTQVGLNAIAIWQQKLPTLPSPVFFQQSGTLCVAHNHDQQELFRLQQILAAKSLPGSFQFVTTQSFEPTLTHCHQQAIFLPQEAQVCPQTLFPALTIHLKTLGIHWHPKTIVKQLQAHNIVTEDKNCAFDWVIDCRGLGAKLDITGLRGVRGELIWLHAPEVHLQRPVRLFHPRYGIYIVPRPQQRYLIGASCLETSDMSPISVQTLLELLSAAYSLHPGFAEARLIHTVVHCRPAFPDHLPKIRIHPKDGTIQINGLYRHGYLFAPVIAQAVSQYLTFGIYEDYLNRLFHTFEHPSEDFSSC
jgi:glycine oxidase